MFGAVSRLGADFSLAGFQGDRLQLNSARDTNAAPRNPRLCLQCAASIRSVRVYFFSLRVHKIHSFTMSLSGIAAVKKCSTPVPGPHTSGILPWQVNQVLCKHANVTVPTHGELELFQSPFLSVASPVPHCSPLSFWIWLEVL